MVIGFQEFLEKVPPQTWKSGVKAGIGLGGIHFEPVRVMSVELNAALLDCRGNHGIHGGDIHRFSKSRATPSSVALREASLSNLLAWVSKVRRRPGDTFRSLMTRARLAIVVARRAIRMSGCFLWA